jgi:hypothetical protein
MLRSSFLLPWLFVCSACVRRRPRRHRSRQRAAPARLPRCHPGALSCRFHPAAPTPPRPFSAPSTTPATSASSAFFRRALIWFQTRSPVNSRCESSTSRVTPTARRNTTGTSRTASSCSVRPKGNGRCSNLRPTPGVSPIPRSPRFSSTSGPRPATTPEASRSPTGVRSSPISPSAISSAASTSTSAVTPAPSESDTRARRVPRCSTPPFSPTGAFSGLNNCCGQGGGTYNIEVIGGTPRDRHRAEQPFSHPHRLRFPRPDRGPDHLCQRRFAGADHAGGVPDRDDRRRRHRSLHRVVATAGSTSSIASSTSRPAASSHARGRAKISCWKTPMSAVRRRPARRHSPPRHRQAGS